MTLLCIVQVTGRLLEAERRKLRVLEREFNSHFAVDIEETKNVNGLVTFLNNEFLLKLFLHLIFVCKMYLEFKVNV